ncbi:T9SS type A sorting domain-containing protein [bacterium]|nr:T9SS type A sorting domain-containing protein [bacterium]
MRSWLTLFIAVLLAAGIGFAATPLGDWEVKSSPASDATGGPDAYGYTWIDSDEPGGPVYNWIDITTTGTLVTGIGDDNWVGPFNTGFPFHYYWYDVDYYYIGSNGYLKFGEPYNLAQPFPASIPMTSVPNDFVGVYIADWYPGQAGQGTVYQWTNNVDSLIVSYIDIPEWNTNPALAGHHDFQVILAATDSSITFQYGTQTGTVSNTDILVGIENNNGQVGLERLHDQYVASNYVVRYEYPASTSYIVHDMACVASANEASEGYFVLNGETIQPYAKVKNSGNQFESSFEVRCLIESQSGTPYYFQTVTEGPLNPGEELEIYFPATWTPTSNEQYFVKCTVALTGDMNPNNDDKWTELHVLTLPGTLLYDDGGSEQAWTWMGGTGGLGQRFVPPVYPLNVDGIKFYIASSSATLPFTAKIFDDDGPNGNPGTELLSVNVPATVANQWYTVNPAAIQITEGAYYVSWHMTGENSPGLGVDQTTTTQIGSRQSWEYTGVWAVFRNAETSDVMIRCDVSSPGGVYNVDVQLTYVSGSPVPAGGGNLTFDVWVENLEPIAIDFDAWLAIAYGGGNPQTAVLRAFTNFQSGWTINRPGMLYPVPAGWPAGEYMMYGRVGDHPSGVWDEDSFPFNKAGVFDGVVTELRMPSNVPDPFDIIETTTVIPEETLLHSAYPNPFNPSTAISIQLSAFSHVNLSVYDVSGRKVATLIDGFRDAGMHEAIFDASDLASGIYLYRLEAGEFNATGKMVLLK